MLSRALYHYYVFNVGLWIVIVYWKLVSDVLDGLSWPCPLLFHYNNWPCPVTLPLSGWPQAGIINLLPIGRPHWTLGGPGSAGMQGCGGWLVIVHQYTNIMQVQFTKTQNITYSLFFNIFLLGKGQITIFSQPGHYRLPLHTTEITDLKC